MTCPRRKYGVVLTSSIFRLSVCLSFFLSGKTFQCVRNEDRCWPRTDNQLRGYVMIQTWMKTDTSNLFIDTGIPSYRNGDR